MSVQLSHSSFIICKNKNHITLWLRDIITIDSVYIRIYSYLQQTYSYFWSKFCYIIPNYVFKYKLQNKILKCKIICRIFFFMNNDISLEFVGVIYKATSKCPYFSTGFTKVNLTSRVCRNIVIWFYSLTNW